MIIQSKTFKVAIACCSCKKEVCLLWFKPPEPNERPNGTQIKIGNWDGPAPLSEVRMIKLKMLCFKWTCCHSMLRSLVVTSQDENLTAVIHIWWRYFLRNYKLPKGKTNFTSKVKKWHVLRCQFWNLQGPLKVFEMIAKMNGS